MKKNIYEFKKIPLIWGYFGTGLFILGALIENSWFYTYLTNIGFDDILAGRILTGYGLSVALFSWFSGIVVQKIGPRKVMWFSLLLLVISTIFLCLIGIPRNNYTIIFISYIFRGGSYPLYAYSFLAWINYRTSKLSLATATSFFWVSFNIGMTILGPPIANFFLKILSGNLVLLYGLIPAFIGAYCSLVLNKDHPIGIEKNSNMINDVFKSVKIIFENKSVFYALLVKSINNIAQFSFVIVMPVFLLQNNFTLTDWTTIWSITYLINCFSGIFFGVLGDKYSWRKTVSYLGGTLIALSCMLIYILTVYFPGKPSILFVGFFVYAIGLGAFGPINAIIPSLTSKNPGIGISILNLGSGLSNLFGPLITTLIMNIFGIKEVFISLSIIYIVSSILSYLIRDNKGNFIF